MVARKRNLKSAAPAATAPSASRSDPSLSQVLPAWILRPAICLGLVVAAWAVFGQTLGFDFVNYDDGVYVFQNQEINHGLSLQGIGWAFTHSVSSNWHPLTIISYMLDAQLYGLKAGGYHFTNVLLHSLAVVLLYLILEQITGARWKSAFVAMCFAIHPLRAESVAWIAERKDVLSGVFFMLTLAAYVGYVRKPGWGLRYLAVLALFALALMSKPTVVPLPFLLLLLDYWPLKRLRTAGPDPPNTRTPGQPLLEKVPLFILSAAACVATLAAQQKAVATVPFFLRLTNALVACSTYLWQMLYPANLAAYYPIPRNGWPMGQVLVSVLMLAIISVGAFVWRRKRPWFVVAWLWYLGMLVPVLGLVQVGSQAHADRYTYLPGIGLYLIIAWAGGELATVRPQLRSFLGGTGAAVALVLVLCAHQQVSVWQDSRTLWEHALAASAESDLAHNNLGLALAEQGRGDEAITHYQRALELNPDFELAYNNLGLALAQKGQLDEAILQYRKALDLEPNYDQAHFNLGVALSQEGKTSEAVDQFALTLKLNPNYMLAYINLGNVFFRQGNFDEAIAQYQRALAVDPNYELAYNDIGTAFVKKNDFNQAIEAYQKAVKLKPDYVMARINLGSALANQGKLDEAIVEYQTALKTSPDMDQLHIRLANVLLQKGEFDRAMSHYERSLELNPNNLPLCNQVAWRLATSPNSSERSGSRALELAQGLNAVTQGKEPAILQTLAAAYAEAGQFTQAISNAQQALLLASAAGNGRLAFQIKNQNDSYQAGQPFRDGTLTNALSSPHQ